MSTKNAEKRLLKIWYSIANLSTFHNLDQPKMAHTFPNWNTKFQRWFGKRQIWRTKNSDRKKLAKKCGAKTITKHFFWLTQQKTSNPFLLHNLPPAFYWTIGLRFARAVFFIFSTLFSAAVSSNFFTQHQSPKRFVPSVYLHSFGCQRGRLPVFLARLSVW